MRTHIDFSLSTGLWVRVLFLAAVMALGLVLPAAAHKTIVFAWVDGDTVYTQSKFAGGRKVKDAAVEVFDAQGNRLLQGKTDDRGEFSFKIPQKADMRIVVSAGTGHRGEWVLSAEEVSDLPPPSPAPTERAPASEEVAPQPVSVSGTSSAEIQAAVEKALDKKLKPILKMLADARNQGPSIHDIVGGIGYILGLVGLGAYINSRKKKK